MSSRPSKSTCRTRSSPFKLPRGGDPVTVPRELDAPPAAPFESVCKLVKVPNRHRVSAERPAAERPRFSAVRSSRVLAGFVGLVEITFMVLDAGFLSEMPRVSN